MKYSLPVIAFIAVVFVCCKKTNSSNTNVLFYNGTWSLPAITAAWNNNSITATAIAQGQSSGTADKPYLQEPAGTNLLTLKSGTDTLVNKNIYSTYASGSSFLFYDTTIATGGTVRILQLTDDFTQPDTAEINYRFIDLAPDTSLKADIWLVNGATDSLRLDSAAVFIGQSVLASSVQAFTTIKYHGETYTVKIKQTGTENLYASASNITFTAKGIYSIIFSGLLNGSGNTGLKISVLHHATQ